MNAPLRRSAWLTILALSLAVSPPVVRAQEMMTYQMVLFRVGPNKEVPPAQAPALMKEHLSRLAKLNADRVNMLYGPFQDNGTLRGIAILDVPDAAAARKVFADDPYVKAGHMVVDVKPWMGPRGWFHLPDSPATPEAFIFGFLMIGPTTTHTPAQVKEIQAGHLAYMDELHKQGKLVAAGPFGDGSDFRGIVIYRVKNVEEAKQLAAKDPAVKAGRLVIDARPWMTFKGILK
jgi:uncharacterized protein YciI